MADAKPISLEAYRLRRQLVSAWERDIAVRDVKPTYLAAEPGKVLLRFSDGAELELSPEHAETWAERLAQMAGTARALGEAGSGTTRAGALWRCEHSCGGIEIVEGTRLRNNPNKYCMACRPKRPGTVTRVAKEPVRG